MPATALDRRQNSAVEIVHEQLRGKNVLAESTGLTMHFAVTEDEVIVGGILSAFLSIVNTSVKRYPIQSITAIDVGKIPVRSPWASTRFDPRSNPKTFRVEGCRHSHAGRIRRQEGGSAEPTLRLAHPNSDLRQFRRIV